MAEPSNMRLFGMALVSAPLSLLSYGIVYELYKPDNMEFLILIFAILIFSILMFIDGLVGENS